MHNTKRKFRKFSAKYIEMLRAGATHENYENDKGKEEEVSYDVCHLVCSDTDKEGIHRPVLDFDFQCRLVPSTTKGHFHLYIDKDVEWENYVELLKAMQKCGLLEEGFVGASIDRKYSSVRRIGLKKGDIVKGVL